MTTTVIDLSVERSVMLNLGRVGENNITEFVFDYTNWTDEFGEGVLSLVLKRQGDAEGYPKSMTVESGQSTWVVDSTDAGVEGIGEAQLTYTVNGDVKKSVIYLTRTCPSIEPVGPAPDPYQSWLDQMIEAKEDAENAAERAETAAENLDTKGYYPDMRVGTADNLLSSSYQTDKTPYIIRRTPYGARERGSIVGGSLVWNQLCLFATGSYTNNGVDYTRGSDGTVTVNGTATASSYHNLGTKIQVQGHKVLLCGCPTGGSSSTYYLRDGYTSGKYDTGQGIMVEAKADTIVQIVVANGVTVNNLVFKPQIFDLTVMFGQTIADYIYSVEQSTAGAGVALAKAWAGITADYYPYDPGSIKSVEGLTAHRMTDGNGDVIGEYSLDSSLTLRGLPKIDGDSIYYDGDIYKVDGTVERKYRYMEVTSCSSAGATGTGRKYVDIPLTSAQAFLSATEAISNAYTITKNVPTDDEKYARFYGTHLYLYDCRFTDKATADSILAEEKPQILYALATPTTEQAEPYTALQICDPNGTEEWVGANMPVGHDTKYYADLKGKIEDIPDAPSADGTYTLKVTVANGVATYSWE